MMTWKNLAIRIGLVLIGVTYGSIQTFVIMNQSQKTLVSELTPSIIAGIEKPLTAITNQVQTDINKLKAKDGSTIELDIRPQMDGKAQTNIQKDSIPEKRSLWRRIFGPKKNR